MNKIKYISALIFILVLSSCDSKQDDKSLKTLDYVNALTNILNYKITPKHKFDKNGLMFSDQGAWFAYSFPESKKTLGFSGPFLMTQQNGVWSSQNLAYLDIKNQNWLTHKTTSYNSHLEQVFTSKNIRLSQKLVFLSGHTALIKSEIKNISKQDITIKYQWKNTPVLADSLQFSASNNQLKITSSKTNAIGYIQFQKTIELSNNNYKTTLTSLTLAKETSKEIITSQSFIFPEYSWKEEYKKIKTSNFDSTLQSRKTEKDAQLASLISNSKLKFQDSTYNSVLAKSHLTLQNNWRIPAGEIKYNGLFPSYHYKWFNGFWSWDSWKHAVGLSYYNTDLAKEQMKLMFHFQKEDGFIVDCVFRDTLIEKHNYRDTKPPLSAWAVSKIYEKDKDIEFIKEFYPKLKKYHQWWYNKRDHDKDGLCEYGSTDGTLIAAKWESGMDNAIRFDNSKILKNAEGAYSLDQESVDLNAYLYAEKTYLTALAKTLNIDEDVAAFTEEAKHLKLKIQNQFYDKNDGWFYDTNLEGTSFIKGEGSEGWTALWANAATQEQAETVKNKMMDTAKFYTKVPFQTMSADHPEFAPLKGYWRGPNWLDQSYFGVKSLRNYGFNLEADKATIQILEGAEGLLEKGKAIRENYHPLTGEGLHAQNFSWSAAHVIMLLSKN